LYSQAGLTSGFPNNGDIAQRKQNGGVDVDFRYQLAGALRLRGTLDNDPLSTRSSPVRRPANAASDFAILRHVQPRAPNAADCAHNVDDDDNPIRRGTTARLLPVLPPSPWSPTGGEAVWAGRHWPEEMSYDYKSATAGRRRLSTTTEDSDVVERTGLSRSAACLLETRCDGRTAPVTVAIPPNLFPTN